MSNMKVAAIFAHPDDEILACGATLAKRIHTGAEVSALILSTGMAARGLSEDELQPSLATLKAQARQAMMVLGVQEEHVTFHDFPDNEMDSVPLLSIVKAIERFLQQFPANEIYTHCPQDLNIDHTLTARAVLTATRPMPGPVVERVYACEVNSSTEWMFSEANRFQPTTYEEITNYIEIKQRALACYEGELRDWPHPRSLKGVEVLAEQRGMQVGIHAAEAFSLIREIKR